MESIMNETPKAEQQSKKEFLHVLIAAILVSAVLISVAAWYWYLIDILTQFYMPFFELLVWLSFLAVLIWSIVYLYRKKRFRRLRSYLPLLIQTASVVIVLTVPFTAIMLDLDFRFLLNDRQAVVQKVLSGELQPNVAHNSSLILLPPGSRHLSKGGGEIIVGRHGDQTYVFFYTFRGILDNFSGFMYRSDDSIPKNGDFGGDFFVTERLTQNWYWTAAH